MGLRPYTQDGGSNQKKTDHETVSETNRSLSSYGYACPILVLSHGKTQSRSPKYSNLTRRLAVMDQLSMYYIYKAVSKSFGLSQKLYTTLWKLGTANTIDSFIISSRGQVIQAQP